MSLKVPFRVKAAPGQVAGTTGVQPPHLCLQVSSGAAPRLGGWGVGTRWPCWSERYRCVHGDPRKSSGNIFGEARH